jgi:hypothetical protein
MINRKATVSMLISLVAVGCAAGRFERHFIYEVPARERVDRMRHYSLEDQYRIFRYGNDRIEPPLMALAEPIAEKGIEAIPFLVGKLAPKADDLTVRDIVLVFHLMSSYKTYNVLSDSNLMALLQQRVSEMKDKEWQGICRRTIKDLVN